MALSDISLADLCADTVLILEDWDELLQIKRRVSPPSYDSIGEMVDAWADVGVAFLGDWQPVSGGTMRAEAALKIKSDAVIFAPCGIDVVQGDRIYRSAMLLWSVAFDAGDSSNPISIGDTIIGGTGAGTANVVQIVYLTATTGTIWYNELVLPNFVNNEVLTAGVDTVTVNGTSTADPWEYVNRVIAHEDHFEIYMTKTEGSF